MKGFFSKVYDVTFLLAKEFMGILGEGENSIV
jgi:hypothetical protein